MKYLNMEMLEGQARVDAVMKGVQDQETLIKAFVPDIRNVGYDEVARAYEVSTKNLNTVNVADMGFSKDVELYLGKGAASAKPDRIKEFVGSMESQDRDGDRIIVAGWYLDDYKKNSTFLWAHQYGGFPYGTSLRTWKDRQGEDPALKFWIYFQDDLSSAEAQAATDYIHALYSSKPPLAKAVSVGFKGMEVIRPQNEEEMEKLDLGQYGMLFKKQSLLELSGCPVGSHADSLLSTAKKMFGAKKGSKVLDALGMEIPSDRKYVLISGAKALDESVKLDIKARKDMSITVVHEGGGEKTEEAALVLTTDLEVMFDEMTKGCDGDGEPDGSDVQKPYENEHAARLEDPAKYEKFRRQNNKFGEGVHAIWGILKTKKVELQAIRFSKDKFSVAEAKKWLKDNEYKPIKFEAAKAYLDELEARIVELEKTVESLPGQLEEITKMVKDTIRDTAKKGTDDSQTGADGHPGTEADDVGDVDLPDPDPALEQDALVSYLGGGVPAPSQGDGAAEPTLYDVMGAE